MSSIEGNQIFIQKEFYDIKFSDLSLENEVLQEKIFENCQFESSKFNAAEFLNCKFIDCEFKNCDLSSVKVVNSTFNEVVFEDSKLIGINWTQAKWPQVSLMSPIKFYKCNLSHSSFYELSLKEIVIEECKANDVDFRFGDFAYASFIMSDFLGSHFVKTKLNHADFTEAMNYNINPVENDISKAIFSIPEVVNLLDCFDIKIK